MSEKPTVKQVADRLINGIWMRCEWCGRGTYHLFKDGAFMKRSGDGTFALCPIPKNRLWVEVEACHSCHGSPRSSESCARCQGTTIELREEEPEIELEVDVVGVKLIHKDGHSRFAGQWHDTSGAVFEGVSVDYPIGKWVDVPGNGAYVSVDGNILLATDDIPDDVILAYFECSKPTGVAIGSDVICYRWVRRLTEPAPHRISSRLRLHLQKEIPWLWKRDGGKMPPKSATYEDWPVCYDQSGLKGMWFQAGPTQYYTPSECTERFADRWLGFVFEGVDRPQPLHIMWGRNFGDLSVYVGHGQKKWFAMAVRMARE